VALPSLETMIVGSCGIEEIQILKSICFPPSTRIHINIHVPNTDDNDIHDRDSCFVNTIPPIYDVLHALNQENENLGEYHDAMSVYISPLDGNLDIRIDREHNTKTFERLTLTVVVQVDLDKHMESILQMICVLSSSRTKSLTIDVDTGSDFVWPSDAPLSAHFDSLSTRHFHVLSFDLPDIEEPLTALSSGLFPSLRYLRLENADLRGVLSEQLLRVVKTRKEKQRGLEWLCLRDCRGVNNDMALSLQDCVGQFVWGKWSSEKDFSIPVQQSETV
jgi:hypothetical protein